MPAEPTEKSFPTSGEHTVRSTINAVNLIFNASVTANYTDLQWEFIKRILAITKDRQTKDFSECDDIDATAFLTEEEFNAIIEQARSPKWW